MQEKGWRKWSLTEMGETQAGQFGGGDQEFRSARVELEMPVRSPRGVLNRQLSG